MDRSFKLIYLLLQLGFATNIVTPIAAIFQWYIVIFHCRSVVRRERMQKIVSVDKKNIVCFPFPVNWSFFIWTMVKSVRNHIERQIRLTLFFFSFSIPWMGPNEEKKLTTTPGGPACYSETFSPSFTVPANRFDFGNTIYDVTQSIARGSRWIMFLFFIFFYFFFCCKDK